MAARLASRPRFGRRAVSQSVSFTAPIGGLNARDSLAAMPPTDAVTLDNFFPTPTTVNLRNGYDSWATGLPADVESLMPYNAQSGTSTLFAASGTAFYNVTSSGAVGAAVRTGLTNARWQHINFGTPGGQFLLTVNGSDKLRGYNGSAWWTDGDGTHDVTGFDTATAIHINSYKTRVYFVEKNSLSVWYLGVNSIAGAATELDLSPIFRLGGYLMAMGTWTVDNAAGVQEYAVFISSEGEVAVYQGYDPSSSGSWSIVGMFRMGRPIGRRCFEKVGSDLVVITADGAFQLSRAMLTDRSQRQDAMTDKIVKLINQDVQNYGANFGWQVTLFPIGNKLIINVPEEQGDTQYQYVMNTISGAWCRFTGWNANCFAVMGDTLYFGGNLGTAANSAYVAKADIGYSDDGAYIFGTAKTAFSNFGAPGRLKRWTMVRPVFYTAGSFRPSMRMDVDFDDVLPTSVGFYSDASGTAWDSALWNTFPWGSVTGIKTNWQSVSGLGYWGALHMRAVNNATPVQWMSTDYVFEAGAIL